MAYNSSNSFLTPVQKKYLLYIFALFAVTIINSFLLNFIKIWEITPDLFIILVVWITLCEGRFVGLLAGFIIGLYVDIITIDTLGTNAFAKTIAAFVASYFYSENNNLKITKNYKFIIIVLLTTFLHNLVYFFFYIKTSEQNFFAFYLKYGFATTIYTTFFAALVFLLQIPSNRLK
jgi:rod shape-determining protein MreD